MQTRFFIIACLLFGCSSDVSPDVEIAASPAVCEAGAEGPELVRKTARVTVGKTSDIIRTFGPDTFIVSSAENTISKVVDGKVSVFAELGSDRWPSNLYVGDDRIFVTTFYGANVIVLDRASGEIVDEWSDPIQTPTDILVVEDRVIVSSANLSGEVWGPGKVTAYDTSGEVIWSVTTEEKNPQFLSLVDQTIWVVNSGEFGTVNGEFVAVTPSSIELFDLEGTRLAHYPMPTNDQDIFAGSLGRAMFVDDFVYFASGTGPYLFKFDRTNEVWLRDANDPIVVYPSDGNALNRAIEDDGLIYMTAYNEDALFIIDTACDDVLAGPISLDDSELLAGPNGLVKVENKLMYLLSWANALGTLEIK